MGRMYMRTYVFINGEKKELVSELRETSVNETASPYHASPSYYWGVMRDEEIIKLMESLTEDVQEMPALEDEGLEIEN
jgi:hypothetical protein